MSRAKISARDRFIALAGFTAVLVLCLVPVLMLRQHTKSPGAVIGAVVFLVTVPLIVLRVIAAWMNRARAVGEQRWRDEQTYRTREQASLNLDGITGRAAGGAVTLAEYARLTDKTQEAAQLDLQEWVHGGLLAPDGRRDRYRLRAGRAPADLRDAIILKNRGLFPFGPRPARVPAAQPPVSIQSFNMYGDNHGTIYMSQESQQVTRLLASAIQR